MLSGNIRSKGPHEVHMEEGPIGRTLLLFAVPILISQLLQELYGIADTLVVGRFIGGAALAATGIGHMPMSVIINFLIGFSSGLSVITSHLFGAREYDRLRRTIRTVNLLSCLIGLAIMVVGIIFAPAFLNALHCPADIMDLSVLYLRIRLLSMAAQLIYNIDSLILRSLGDTVSPMLAFFASAVLNIVLDLVFVAGFGWGLAGAAAATVIAQVFLAAMMIFRLGRLNEAYRPGPGTRLLTLREFRETMRIDLPSGFQAFFMSVSSLIVQTVINGFGSTAVAGMTLYARLEGFLYYPAFAYGIALTSFVGQNLGAGRIDRVKKSIRISIVTMILVVLPLSLILIRLSPAFTGLFTDDAAILANAQRAILINFTMYTFYAVNQCLLGTVKGLGNTLWPMITTLVSYALFRGLWCKLMVHVFPTMDTVYWSYNISFLIMMAMLLPVFFRMLRSAQGPKNQTGGTSPDAPPAERAG